MVVLHNFPVETVVGSYLKAAVTMKSANGDAIFEDIVKFLFQFPAMHFAHVVVSSAGSFFYICDAFNSLIKWKSGSESFVIVNATQELLDLKTEPNTQLRSSVNGSPCSWTYVFASHPGQSVIHAIFSKEDHYYSHSPVVLKASLRIVAYLPLIVCQAGDGNQFGGYWVDLAQAENDNQSHGLEELYLVPGTSLDIALVGGPELWDKAVDFIETVEVLDEGNSLAEDGVLVHRVSSSYKNLYGVLCRKLGTYVSFSIYFLVESILDLKRHRS